MTRGGATVEATPAAHRVPTTESMTALSGHGESARSPTSASESAARAVTPPAYGRIKPRVHRRADGRYRM